MKKIKVLAILFLGIGLNSFAQHDHEEPFKEDDITLIENVKKAHPEWADDIDKEEAKLEKFTAEYIENHKHDASRADVDYIIPVVFHILHQGGEENLTDTEIHDAMRILNEDFQLRNEDISDVNARFKNVVGDAKIEFRLARLDPNGNPTTGIDRIETSRTNNAGESSKLNPWPRSTYLNIWVVKSIASGAAGYTYLPSTAHFMPNRDGIILLYTYLASVRTGTERRSRALTHEIGHWLNLPHLWGRTNNPGVTANCSDDDGVFDTPNTIGWTSCNLNGFSCGSYDNIQNFMEYSYCSNMFTEGQVLRMKAALSISTAQRNLLVSEANNRKAGVLDLDMADFTSTSNYACLNTPVDYKDISPYGATTWYWEFEGGTPSTSTAQNPQVTYSTPGTYKVKLSVTDSKGNRESKEVDDYIVVNRSVGTFLPYEEGFESSSESTEVNWVAQNEDDDLVFWKIKEGVAYEGKNCLLLENFNNSYYQEESVISSPIDLSNIDNPTLTFYLSHAAKTTASGGGSSKFGVYFSSDCGQTWRRMYYQASQALSDGKAQDSYFTPTSKSDWNMISISGFGANEKVQNGLLKFTVENRDDNNFYIDNINIVGTYMDIPVLEFPLNGMDSVSSEVYLDWKAVPVIDQYDYQLSEDATFINLVNSGSNPYLGLTPYNEDSRFKASNLTPGKTYYWRVRAVRGSLISSWSPTWSFTVSSSGNGHKYIDGEALSIHAPLPKSDVDFVMYPNPSNGAVNISVLNEVKVAQIQVYSMQGQLVWDNELKETNSTVINGGELVPGLYVVNVTIDGSNVSKKLVIK